MKIGNFIKNMWFNLRVFWHSMFMGMKTADQKMMGVTKEGKISDTTVEQQLEQDGVYADLLKGEVTQEVKELRDSTYRGYKASFDYKYIGNGNSIKKTTMLSDNINAYNPEDLDIILVQDNKLIVKGTKEVIEQMNDANDNIDNSNTEYLLIVERDNYPRFKLEKFVKKIVVRRYENDYTIDLYCSIYARQNMPGDSLFITEIKNIMDGKIKPSDTVMIETVEFITDACYGAKDITLYKFGNLNYKEINVYDGNFVITYSGNVICDGLDLTEQYRTAEMDKKYKNVEMRENAVIYFEEKEEKTLDTDLAIEILKGYSK